MRILLEVTNKDGSMNKIANICTNNICARFDKENEQISIYTDDDMYLFNVLKYNLYTGKGYDDAYKNIIDAIRKNKDFKIFAYDENVLELRYISFF